MTTKIPAVLTRAAVEIVARDAGQTVLETLTLLQRAAAKLNDGEKVLEQLCAIKSEILFGTPDQRASLRELTDAELTAAIDAVHAELNEHHKTYNEATDSSWVNGESRDVNGQPYWITYRAIDAKRYPLNAEQRRRQSLATKAKNAAKRAANAVTGFTVGQKVAFKALGFTDREYLGTVVKVGRTGKVTVEYSLLNGKLKQKAVDATSGIRAVA